MRAAALVRLAQAGGMMLTVDELVARVGALPSLPAALAQLLASMACDDVDLHRLGADIARDQALAAKLLRLANSSFYGLQAKVATIHQAVGVLGVQGVRSLVTACAITGSFPARAIGSFNFEAFWRHSVATAVCARSLAPHLRIDPESGFSAGLLHDIGTLVLVTGMPAQYAAMLSYRAEHDCYLIEAEQAQLGFDHALVGSALCAHWKFPKPLQDAVAAHHAPDLSSPASLGLLVHAANIFTHALDLSGVDDDLVPALSPAVWNALALSKNDCMKLFQATETGFADACQLLFQD